MPTYKRPDPRWNTDPDAALAEMERRIDDPDAFQNFANCKALERLPKNLGNFSNELLDLNYTNISDLKGLREITETSKLSLGKRVTDLSEVRHLTHLTSLDCAFCGEVTDLTPISSCTGLEHLQLDVGKVADLSPLEALSKLKTITLTNYRGQKIPDMEACTHLNIEAVEHIELDGPSFSRWSNLEYLQIKAANRSVLSAPIPTMLCLTTLLIHGVDMPDHGELDQCKRLKRLEIRNSNFSDVNCLLGLNDLQSIDISQSSVREAAALSHLPNLNFLSAENTGISHLEGWDKGSNIRTLKLNNTKIDDLKPLAGTGLNRISVADTNVSNITPIVDCQDISYMDLHRAPVRSLSGIERLRRLAYLDIRFTLVESLNPIFKNPDFLVRNLDPIDFREAGNHGFYFSDTPAANNDAELQELSRRTSPRQGLLNYMTKHGYKT